MSDPLYGIGSDDLFGIGSEYYEHHATFCPDCESEFFEDEPGYDADVCFVCGGTECFEVPA